MDNTSSSKIILISGKQNVGKSTLCKKIVCEFAKSNAKISGILSESVKISDKPLAIYSIDIQTNEKQQLAIYSPGWDVDRPVRKWEFQKGIFEWGNTVLIKSVPTDLLIIDELGYLEFEEKKGWYQSFSIIKSNSFKCAILVIRPEFIDLAKKYWHIDIQIFIDNLNQVDTFKKELTPRIRSFLQP